MICPIPQSAVPKSRADAAAWLRLARSRRVGPTTFVRLLRQFGTPQAALEALPDIAAEAGERRYQSASATLAHTELDAGRHVGARLLCLGAANYPTALYDLTDPPPVLWAFGDTSLLDRPMIALVGARNASAIGQRMATHLAQDLAKHGHIVVSGMARGIDAAAHAAATPAMTIAVLAGGVDVPYPKENTGLFQQIGAHGLRLSEMPLGHAPRARDFPRRNRIISGLCSAVVVVEGAARSGSLITARNALDQGREVMAVPGHPLDARAAGCNMLIRDGALLVRSAEDILTGLPQKTAPQTAQPPEPPIQTPAPEDALPDRILSLLGTAPIAEDALIRATHAPPQAVLAALSELSISGTIDRQPGGLIARVA